uniref:ExbD/TolR family protein n=1 Tax=uncultured Caulobacter sp. TaxID=158749 RepID=UPI002600A9B5|nr:hypothetical protein [uncultured Caulobacter sp.]
MKRGTKIAIGVLIGLAAIVLTLCISITSIRIELPPAEAPRTTVGMQPDGQLTVDGKPTTLDTLTQDVAARFANVPMDQQRVMIRASGDVKYDLRPPWGRTDPRSGFRWGPVLSRHGLATSRGLTAEGSWGGDGAAGRTRRPYVVCVFRLADRSARLFLPVRMGGVSVFQLGSH